MLSCDRSDCDVNKRQRDDCCLLGFRIRLSNSQNLYERQDVSGISPKTSGSKKESETMNLWQLVGASKAKGTERSHPPQARTRSIEPWVAETNTYTHTETHKVTKKGSGPLPRQSKIMNGSLPYCFAQPFRCNSHIESHWGVAANNALRLPCTTCHKIHNHIYAGRDSFCNMLTALHGHYVLTTQNTPCDLVKEPWHWASWW